MRGIMSKYIFISYAHNDGHDDVVIKFKDLLIHELRPVGFEIFFDKDKLKEGDWQRKLEANICKSDWFIFIVSKKSVSYTGYCLNELTMAHEKNIKIIPVVLDDSPVPITINRLQRFFLYGNNGVVCNDAINEVVKELVSIIKDNKEVGYYDEDLMLEQALRPISCVAEISRHRSGYIGREELFKRVESWLGAREAKNKLFLVKAFPGFGKTAFSANCSLLFNQAIGAVHFCKFDNAEKADAKHIVTSLAFWLGCKLPAYRRELINIIKKSNGRLYNDPNHNATSLFDLLFVDTLARIEHDGSSVLVIIDALDEAIWQGHINNDLCNLLRMYVGMLPKWFKILVTTRDDSSIISDLMNVSVTYEFTRDINEKDIKSYFATQLKTLGSLEEDVLNNTIELLFKKSEGSFVYAREIINKISQENILLENIDDLPNGLYELYKSTFDRIFKVLCRMNYEDVSPLLGLICITPEELTDSFLCQYFDWTDTVMRKRLDVLSSVIRLKDEIIDDNCDSSYIEKKSCKKIDIIHKTLIDWLTQSNDEGYPYAGEYHISKHDAYVGMFEYMRNIYEKNSKYSTYCLRHYGMVLIQLIESEKRVDNRSRYIEYLQDMLTDEGFQNERIALLTLDTAIKMCADEMRCYYKYIGIKIYNLYNSSTFIKIFSKYRRYLYNSGLFFTLKRIGFSDFLDSVTSDWELEGEVGKIFYYYITENFDKTIKAVNEITSSRKYKRELAKNKKLYAELYNVKGLAQRKLVDFNGAMQSFNAAIKYAEDCNYSFELSLAYLIKSKINVRMDCVAECKSNGDFAVSWLKKAIKNADNYNTQLDYTLFLAEEYRVLCDNMIWAGDIEAATEYMNCSENIYSNHVTTDRYYIRSQYTMLFLRIVKNEDNLLGKIKAVEAKIKDGNYDVGQINIVKALFLLLNQGDKGEACKAARKAYTAYSGINCPLEQEEARCLHNIIVDEIGSGAKIPEYTGNEYINVWILLFEKYIKSLMASVRG